MAADDDFFVRFWGVRGSIASAGRDTVVYGGNTSSLEIRCGEHILLFDAGTGFRYLGNSLIKQAPFDADVFLTHTHLDHVVGLPFFVPAFNPVNKFRIWAGHLLPQHTIREVLGAMMTPPLFPVPLDIFRAAISFHDFHAGETIDPKPGVVVRTAALNHPNNATGYRIEYGGKSICYITDTEHKPDKPDPNVLNLMKDADIVIYDAMYTDETFRGREGWGHSTWQEGARLCDLAGAKTYVVFHHDPDHNDAFMDGVSAQVARLRPGGAAVAREGMVLRP
ncbi:MAG: MBL fold metallo-hydrolase [Alphaproteobacteria bacterium]|nr:MBL fold metallo-hydrolase [Alphaproteobacteria bacterium]